MTIVANTANDASRDIAAPSVKLNGLIINSDTR